MMTPATMIAEHFRDVKDPRTGRRVDHFLIDIISIAICAVICGADSWVEFEEFGQAKEEWLGLVKKQLPDLVVAPRLAVRESAVDE